MTLDIFRTRYSRPSGIYCIISSLCSGKPRSMDFSLAPWFPNVFWTKTVPIQINEREDNVGIYRYLFPEVPGPGTGLQSLHFCKATAFGAALPYRVGFSGPHNHSLLHFFSMVTALFCSLRMLHHHLLISSFCQHTCNSLFITYFLKLLWTHNLFPVQ